MDIFVNPELKQFFLSYDNNVGWVPCYGHEIKVGSYTFCAALMKSSKNDSIINISEVSSGIKIFDCPLTKVLMSRMEDTLVFYKYFIGPILINIIEANLDFESKLMDAKKLSYALFGPMPAVADVSNLVVTNSNTLLN